MTSVAVQAGAESSAIDAALTTSWPPSQQDATRIAQAAGAGAAAAACSAYGAAAAAPLCAKIGGAVAAFVSDKLVDGLGRIFARRNRDAWERYRRDKDNAESFFAYQTAARDLAEYEGEAMVAMTDSLEALYVDLNGEPSGASGNDWRAALAYVGGPFARVPGQHAPSDPSKPLWSLTTDPVTWWQGLTGVTATNAPQWFRILGEIADEELALAGAAAAVLAAKIAGDAAAKVAEQAATTVSVSPALLHGGKLVAEANRDGEAKGSTFVPVVAALTLVSAMGAGAWYAHRQGWF